MPGCFFRMPDELEQFLLESEELQKRRYEAWHKAAIRVCAELEISAQGEIGAQEALFAVQDEILENAFALYLQHLAGFKEAMSMDGSRINHAKIAALTISCVMERRPIVNLSEAPIHLPHVEFANSLLALMLGASMLDVDIECIPAEIRSMLMIAMLDLDMVQEGWRSGGVIVDTEPPFAFSRRLRMLITLMSLTKEGYADAAANGV